MKTQTFTVLALLLAGSLASAKVSDFNNLINENIKAQDSLHKEVNGNIKVVRQEIREKAAGGKVTVVETDMTSYNAPSRKMKFRKEVRQYQPSAKKQMDRVATEFKEAERDF